MKKIMFFVIIGFLLFASSVLAQQQKETYYNKFPSCPYFGRRDVNKGIDCRIKIMEEKGFKDAVRLKECKDMPWESVAHCIDRLVEETGNPEFCLLNDGYYRANSCVAEFAITQKSIKPPVFSAIVSSSPKVN